MRDCVQMFVWRRKAKFQFISNTDVATSYFRKEPDKRRCFNGSKNRELENWCSSEKFTTRHSNEIILILKSQFYLTIKEELMSN